MESLVVVHNLNQQVNVLELVYAQTLPDGIDFNLELHFKTLSNALLLGLVINQVISLFYQQLKHIFNLFVLVTDIDSISSLNRLVVNQLTLALTLVLAVHNRCVLVHLRITLSSRVSTLVAWIATSSRVVPTWIFIQKVEVSSRGRFPGNCKLLFMNDLIAISNLPNQILRF